MRNKSNAMPQPPQNQRLPQSNRAVSKCESCLTMIMVGCSLDPVTCNGHCSAIGFVGTLCFVDPVAGPMRRSRK